VLEPDRAKQTKYWWPSGGAHLHEEGNHAFNHALLTRLEARPPTGGSGSESSRLWRFFERRSSGSSL
jgi:hypothetical protein